MTTETAPNPRLRKAFIATAFFTFVVLMHITFPHMGGSGLRLPFNATVWMGFGVMMALAMWPAAQGVIRYSAFHKGLALLLLALWLPFAWSWNEASLIALPRMLTVTAGAILLLGVTQLQLSRRDWWWCGMAILIGTLLEAAYGYIQLYLFEPENWLGYDPTTGRPYGIFQQVNLMASFLVTGLVISAWLIGEARNRLEAGVTLLAPLFMPALILVIQSRTGWLAALITVPMVLVHLWYLDRERFRAWTGALAAGGVLAAVVWWAPWAEASIAAKAVGNPGERLPVYLHSLRMIAEEPLSGWGYGRFQHDFLHSFADWRAALPVNRPEIVEPIITQNYVHPHNELLFWGIEGGLLPLLAILIFAGWVSWRIWRHGPHGGRLLLTALLLPISLHAMTELPFYLSLAHWLAFLLVLGMVVNLSWKTKERHNRYTFGIRVGAFIAAPVLVLFMGTHLLALNHVKTTITDQDGKVNTTGIINPLGISALISNLNSNLILNNAITLNDEEEIRLVRIELEEEMRKRPSFRKLENLKTSLSALGNTKALAEKERLTKHLFPEMAKADQVQKSEESNRK